MSRLRTHSNSNTEEMDGVEAGMVHRSSVAEEEEEALNSQPSHISSQQAKKRPMVPDYFRTDSHLGYWLSTLNTMWLVLCIYCVYSSLSNYMWHLIKDASFSEKQSVMNSPFIESAVLIRLQESDALRYLKPGWLPDSIVSVFSAIPNVIPGLTLGVFPTTQYARKYSVIDLSDHQYRHWRSSLLSQTLLFAALALTSRIMTPLISTVLSPRIHPSTIRLIICAIIGFGFAVFIHSTDILIQLSLLIINFVISRMCLSQRPMMKYLCVWFTWIFNLGSVILATLITRDQFTLTLWIPLFKNVNVHWQTMHRFMILRCISFNLDLLFTVQSQFQISQQKTQLTSSQPRSTSLLNFCSQWLTIPGYLRPMSALYRSEHHLTDLDCNSDFSILGYIAYCYYPPLYFAGPILSYHDFLSQFRKQQRHPLFDFQRAQQRLPTLLDSNFLFYVGRFLCSFVMLEVTLHFVFVGALNRSLFSDVEFVKKLTSVVKAGKEQSEVLSVLLSLAVPTYPAFLVVCHVYLKFNTFWKYYRLMAIMEGVITVENMQRCVTHSESVRVFWKAWHSSFNRWNVRYLLIPLSSRHNNQNNQNHNGSGALRQSFVVLGVFVFTAAWHGDFNFSLASWGIIMAMATIIELCASFLSNKFHWFDQQRPLMNKILQSIGGWCAIMALISANCVGFGCGLRNTLRLHLTDLINFGLLNNVPCLVQSVYLMISIFFLTFFVNLHHTWLYSHKPSTNCWKQ